MIFVKSLVIWLVFMALESLNGAIRMGWLSPALGVERAEQISFVLGALLVLAIATLFNPWLNASRVSQQLAVGALWMGLTLAFEILLGVFVLGYSKAQIAARFNPLNGGFMPIELLLLILAPWLAATIRNSFSQTTPPTA